MVHFQIEKPFYVCVHSKSYKHNCKDDLHFEENMENVSIQKLQIAKEKHRLQLVQQLLPQLFIQQQLLFQQHNKKQHQQLLFNNNRESR